MSANKLVATAAVVAGVACAAAEGAGSANAGAGPDISPAGWQYVTQFGNSVICPMLDHNHTFAGVNEAMYAVRADGFSPYEAAGIVVASVVTYCTRNWPLMVDYATGAIDTSVTVVAGNAAADPAAQLQIPDDPATLVRLQLPDTGLTP